MSLQDLLTIDNPLGPTDHANIMRHPQNDAAPNSLLYQTAIFDTVIKDARPIIVGRRGSGKTSIVSAMLSLSEQSSYYSHPPAPANAARHRDSRDVFVVIDSWDQLDRLVEKVGADARRSVDGDWSSLLPETAARHWSRRIWTVIFEKIYQASIYDRQLRAALPLVPKYIEGSDIVSDTEEITDKTLNEKFTAVRGSVLEYLRNYRRRCFVVIDSLEEYPILSPRFERLMSGLLKCVTNFAREFPPVQIACCIPDEVVPFFMARSSNRLKDFGPASASSLRWRPVDLLRITAERYREFLILHDSDDTEFIDAIKHLQFTQKKDLQRFYSEIMPEIITNHQGIQEPTISYVIRHTQLLPREFLMIFDRAIVESHRLRGTWRYIEESAIVKAVQETEGVLSDQVLHPYQRIYPELITAIDYHFTEIPAIFSLGDMDRVIARFAKRVDHETIDPRRALYNMGVIGILERNGGGEPGISGGNGVHKGYEYASFHFNSQRPITFANGEQYCIHPIFCGRWRLDGRSEKRMVYFTELHDEVVWGD